MNIQKLYLIPALLIGLLFASPGWSALIIYSAKGTDNMPNGYYEGQDYTAYLSDPSANFFQIEFKESTSGFLNESITQVSIDLSAGGDTDAFFDPSDGDKDNDVNGGGKGFGPVIGSGTTGIDASDVTFSLNTTSGISPILDIWFASGSFTVGDILSFGIDIDNLDDNLGNQAGGLLGSQGVGLTTKLEGSCKTNVDSVFERASKNVSKSTVELCTPAVTNATSIPEPESLALMLIGLIGLFFIKTNLCTRQKL